MAPSSKYLYLIWFWNKCILTVQLSPKITKTDLVICLIMWYCTVCSNTESQSLTSSFHCHFISNPVCWHLLTIDTQCRDGYISFGFEAHGIMKHYVLKLEPVKSSLWPWVWIVSQCFSLCRWRAEHSEGNRGRDLWRQTTTTGKPIQAPHEDQLSSYLS